MTAPQRTCDARSRGHWAGRIRFRHLSGFTALLILLCCHTLPASEDDPPQVLYVTLTDTIDGGQKIVMGLCDFYGLVCEVCPPKVAVGMLDGSTSRGQDILAVIMEVPSLGGTVCPPEAKVLWRRVRERRIPVLVLCAEPGTVPLADLEGSGPPADVRFTPQTSPSSWRVTRGAPQVTRELTGISGRIRRGVKSPGVAIDPANLNDRLIPLLLVQSGEGIRLPAYIEWKNARAPVFLAAFSRTVRREDCVFGPDVESNLPGAIPILTFLRFAGGDRCWRRPIDYANLTIDDPRLTEPFGYLSYSGLLDQMQKARFHTTIAFIPWNYDRNDDEVVTLFRDHPEYFSLCVHGNNHDHWEFYRYRTIPGDPIPAKPLPVQEADLRQGVARMERLRQLTGLDYDPVMVFPHFIAPVQTLTSLKQQGFLMTVNARNLPLDLVPQRDRLSPLLCATLRYATFPSVRRHPAESLSRAEVALELFLDNPVIFYEHQEFFRPGMDAFNANARMVNEIQPETKWAGLGEIARHLYLQRERPDGNCDVRIFCRCTDLVNDQQRERTFFIHKPEDLTIPIERVLVDGVPHPYTLSDGDLSLATVLGPQRRCRIDVEYKGSLQPVIADISKSDPRVNRLRALSDFRDCTLMECGIIERAVDFYYASMLFRLGVKGAVAFCCLFATAVVMVGWMLIRRMSWPRHRSHRSELNLLRE